MSLDSWAVEEKLRAERLQLERERLQLERERGYTTGAQTVGQQDGCGMQAETRPHFPLDDRNDAIRRISNRLDYHAPRPDQIIRHQAIRDAAKAFVTVIVRNTNYLSDESRSAQQGVEAVVMLANKSIALE